ncbi:unnamed protein product [Thlaspi arvense]|uniref:Uncharacterized protein n=1 Tax=Thlaspi arvense TaxID=13288 RepID=A0AAU9SBU4_THLAR|nr:unnamed protein product [Thlaspi arvense]
MEEAAETVVYEQDAVSFGGDARGKHRILAELGRVEQEVRFLEVSNISFRNSHFRCGNLILSTCRR